MVLSNNFVDFANIFVGYREKAGKRNPFGKWYGFNGVPWCAQFVSYCLYACGFTDEMQDKGKIGFAYCPSGINWYKNQGAFYRSTPKIGDIVFFDWQRDGVSDHVGIVTQVLDDFVLTIEGNTSDSNWSNGGTVARKKRAKHLVAGYGRPKFNPAVDYYGEIYPWIGTPVEKNKKSSLVIKWRNQMIERGWSRLDPEGTSIFTQIDANVLTDFQKEFCLDIDGVLGAQSYVNAWLQPLKK